MSNEWMTEGHCVNEDPNLFHSNYAHELVVAANVCKSSPCPVIDKCLRFALDNMVDDSDDPATRAIGLHGVWGGTTPVERLRMVNRRPSMTQRRVA